MTFNQIQYFCEVAKYENFRKASESLYISQPSLSRSISALEEELQVPLFEKKGRGIALTKAGRMFLDYARRIVDECDSALDRMSELASGKGRIDIGYVFPLAGHFIPHHVREFLNVEENRGISFNFWQNHTPAIVRRIQQGDLDIGFGGCVDKIELEYYPLFSQELIIITPEDHPLNSRVDPSVSLAELEEYPLIGYDRDSWMGIHTNSLYKEFGLHPQIIIECPDEYSILALVRENFGIALVPKTDLLSDMKGVSIHSIRDHNLAHQIFMFWMKDREHLPAVERFIEFMKSVSQSGIDSPEASKTYLKDIIHLDRDVL